MKKNPTNVNLIKISLHLLAWSLFLGVNYYFMKQAEVGKDFVWLFNVNTLISGSIFYINYLLLVPKFFFPRKRMLYFVSVAAMITFFFFVSNFSGRMVSKYIPGKFSEQQSRSEFERRKPGPPPPGLRDVVRPPFHRMYFMGFTFSSVFIVFFSLGLRILERQDEIEKSRREMEGEKLKAELSMLKNQISPHFFFNTLNNIYSLAGTSTEDSKKAILQLSKLMRYLLYDSEKGDTRLSDEIAFMNNFIDLMKLRISEKVNLSVSFPEKYADVKMPPLLFIPFIENAFKHGVSYRGDSFIEIRMEKDNNTITFICRNSIGGRDETMPAEKSGIGLENVKRRLELIFPGKHNLKISRTENEFYVCLQLKLS